MTGRFNLSAQRRELLDALLRAEGIERAPAQTIPRRADPAAPVPLTFSQSRFWFLENLSASTSAYVISAALRVRGDFRPEVFAAACDEIVRRHESLRTVFLERDGQPVQQVRDDLRADVRVVDVPPVGDATAEVRRREEELIGRPFDLTTGPLLRVELLRFAPDDTVVLLTMHHIVSDRWSMGVLLRELTTAYAALSTGRSVELPPLPVQYPDFALWQQESASEVTWKNDLAYWLERLHAVPAETGLPTDRPRPRQKSYRGASVPVELPAALVTRLRGLARAEGATLFMVLAAAFTALVHRLGDTLGDTEDVVVGTPVANRTLVELEPLIGPFLNTVALRTSLGGDPTVRELVRRVSQVCLQAYEHQGIPFERLVEELQPDRSLASTPIFQVMFSYQNVPFPSWGDGPVRIEPIGLPARKAEFDLLLDLFEDGDTVWGRLEYSVDIFDEPTAARLVRLLRQVLDGMADGPDQLVRDLPLLGPAERQAVLAAGTGPDREWPESGLAHEWLAEWARRTPDAAAVRFGADALTYGQLDGRVDTLAGVLRAAGVAPGAPVGVASPPSVALVVAVLAVLRAGGGFVAVDPVAAPERSAFVLADAAVGTVLTTRSVLDAGLPVAAGVAVVCLDDPDPLAGPVSSGPVPDGPVGGPDVAYVTYPVGSPTGVAHRHAAVRNRLLWLRDEHGLRPGDQVRQRTPLAFDVSMWELLWPLTAGATLVGAEHREPCYLIEVVRAGGEPVELAVPAWECRPGGGPEPVPAGSPIANTRLHVLDRWSRPLPVGVPGEVHVEGPGLPRHRTGDLGRLRPDGTVEHLGRRDRQVRVRGYRIGLRDIESALTAHAGVGRAVVVPRSGATSGDVRLVAYLTAAPGGPAGEPPGAAEPPRSAELAAHLRDRLPEHMVPAAFVVLPGLPLTPYGAVDVAALPELDLTETGAGTPYVAPRTDLERSLAGLWRELLDVEQVGAQDNFFDLGGHSLLATKLGAQVRAAHKVKLPMRVLFDHPTLAALAAWIEERKAAGGSAAPEPIRAADRTVPLPLSFAQDRLCRHHPLGPEDPLHNVLTAVVLRGALDAPALRRALDDLLARHEALRTRFVRSGDPTGGQLGGPTSGPTAGQAGDGPGDERYQVVDPAGPWPLTSVDLTGDPEAAGTLRRLVEREERRPFRIADELPVRGTLVRVAPDEHVLVLVLHHLVTDNWSYGLLVRDLCEYYNAHATGRPARLPELEIQYPDFAAWQQRQLAAGGFDEQVRFWRAELAGLPPTPTWRAPAHQLGAAATGGSASFTVDAEAARGLTELARRDDASLYMVLMAAFSLLLSAYAERDDIVVVSPEAGRDRPEAAQLVGYFVNDLVVRADLSGNPTFRELVDRVRRRILGAYAHPGVPLWTLDEAGDPGRNPFQVLFNLLNAPIPDVDLHGLRSTPLDLGTGYVFTEVTADLRATENDLALIMREDGGRLRGMWLYAPDRIDPRVVAALTGRWPALIDLVVADPDRRVDEVRAALRSASGDASGDDASRDAPRPAGPGERG